MYRAGDKVSYIYNGMSGIVTAIIDSDRVTVAWQTYDGRQIFADMATKEIELIAGGDHKSAAVVAAVADRGEALAV